MKNQRNRPQGYFLTILRENDSYFVGKDKGSPISSRRYLNLGSTIKEIREEVKKVKLLDGEHLWMGYQGVNTMPSVIEAWIQIYGKKIQYRSRKRNRRPRHQGKPVGEVARPLSYREGFNFYGVHFESSLPFVCSSDLRFYVERDRLGYNFTRDVIARRDLTVQQKKYLCSLCECNGVIHDDCRNLISIDWSEIRKGFHFNRCDFSYMPDEWEEHVKVSFPFGVICYKWGVNKKVIEYVKAHLW